MQSNTVHLILSFRKTTLGIFYPNNLRLLQKYMQVQEVVNPTVRYTFIYIYLYIPK